MSGLVLQLAAASQDAAAGAAAGAEDVALHVFGLDLSGVEAVVPLIAGVIGILGTVWAAARVVSSSIRPLQVVAVAWETRTHPERRPATHIAAFVHNRTKSDQSPAIRVVLDPGWLRRRVPGWHKRLSAAGDLQLDPEAVEIPEGAWREVRLKVIHWDSGHPRTLVVARVSPRRIAVAAPNTSSAPIR